ncbi:energy transducer TonB [Bdellovibrio sp. SKB1291214]|uniref:TonB family protein n=1 Tax=Bdellovibrio sp. SKB1291214 TaxID=1732569 RepID=UPI000B51A590|nr:TonB family protein [Bdellovibrio sp. SKB1291214]UYL08998.1 energy transducer TonB [Bdellovibrio sp. SKB1291214]
MNSKYKELPPFAISLFLHLLVFAGMSIIAMKPQVLAPFGAYKKGGAVVVEFESLPSVATAANRIAAPVVSNEGDIALEKKKIKPTEVTPQNAEIAGAKTLGHADGILTSGPLGEANGSHSATIKERYLYELRILIEGRKVYPVTSKRLRETGRVLVEFTVQQDGSITAVGIKQAAAFERLNEAAKTLIAGIGKYKPLPQEFAQTSARLEIPIEYSLQ